MESTAPAQADLAVTKSKERNVVRAAEALPRAGYGNLWLVVGEERFAISDPTRGDITRRPKPGFFDVPEDAGLITSGVAASSLARLYALGGQPAHVETQDGARLLSLRVEKVDPRFSVVVARVLDAEMERR